MFYFGLFVYLATVTVIFANPLPHGSNDWIAAKKLIDTRQVSAEDPSDTDSFGTDTGVETEPVKNLDSSTSSQNALVVADLVRSSDNGCISNADSDHLLDDNIQQGNTFRRRTTPNFCPTVTQLVPPRIPGRRFKITPSSQPSKGQTHITRPTGEEPCAGLTTRMLPENLELVTCGGPEIGDPRSRLIDMVAHCVKGKSSQSSIVLFSLISARPNPNQEMFYRRSSNISATHGPI